MDKTAYCPMPFVTLTVNPTGVMTRCMMSMKPMGPIAKSTYENEDFQTLRKNMLNGVWDLSGCESCKRAEDDGRKSQRTKWLDREEKYLGTTGIYEQNTDLVSNEVHHLYMNFNSICNFKCRMCGPHYSNAWIPDHNKLSESGATKNTRPWIQDTKFKQQIDVDKFFVEFGSMLSNLKQIWITGGEPFMDNSIYKFFEKLEDYCDVSKLKVLINTNATKISPEKLKPLLKVKILNINVSVDATGKLFPYMRGYNYTFKKLDKKIKSICALKDEHPNLKVNVNAAYQIFNILDIEDFFTWATKITDNPDGTQVEYRTLSGPPFLRARNAPNKLKDEAIVMLNRLKNRYPKNSYLDDIIKELNQPQVEVDRENFARWNSKLDELRDEKLKDANPRLWSWLNREGVV